MKTSGYSVMRNLRRESAEEWLEIAKKEGVMKEPRTGKKERNSKPCECSRKIGKNRGGRVMLKISRRGPWFDPFERLFSTYY